MFVKVNILVQYLGLNLHTSGEHVNSRLGASRQL